MCNCNTCNNLVHSVHLNLPLLYRQLKVCFVGIGNCMASNVLKGKRAYIHFNATKTFCNNEDKRTY